MKTLQSAQIALGLMLAWGTVSAHAEVVGRVIALAGDATTLRQGREIPLTLGAPVESGDLLKLGAPGNLQVRFNDEAIVALRSNSQLRIDNYAFANKPESDSSIMSLLKGGMRTITGVIGRVSRGNYAVNTPTSTIGIRGTHFTLVQCDNDCINADGSTAANGTFGGISDGRIAVTNDAGEREFGKNEFFFVANRAVLPESLLAPPSFLRDRLDGQAKAGGKGRGTPGGNEAVTGLTDDNPAESTVPQPVADLPTQLVPQTALVLASEQPFVTQSTVNPFVAYVNFALAGVNYSGGGAFGESTLLLADAERIAEIERLQAIFPVALSMSTDIGYSDAAGQVHWGHWFGPDGTIGGYGEHWVVGNPTPLSGIPSAGIYAYDWVGGTRPTDNLGNIGTIISAGSLTVDFTSQRVNSLSPFAWTVGGHAYSLTVSDLLWGVGGSGTKTLSCESCTSSSVEVEGQFTGSVAQGIIAGIYTSATYAGGEVHQTASAQVYATASLPAPVPLPDPTPVPEPTPVPTEPSSTCTTYPCTYSGSHVEAEAYRSTYSSLGSTPYTGIYSWASSGASTVTWYSEPQTYTEPGYTQTYTHSGDIEAGSDPVANLTWARYSWTSISEGPGYTSTTEGWGHHMEGDPTFSLPSSGSYTYSHIGGTRPTDAYGNVGTLTSGGSWTVNFTDHSVATVTPVAWTLNGISYSLTVPTQVLTWETGSYSDASYTANYLDVTPITNFNLTCGSGCTPVVAAGNGNVVAPWFFGANAEAMGVGYSTVVEVGGTTHNTSHIQAYKR